MSLKTADNIAVEMDDAYYRLEIAVAAAVSTATTGKPTLFLTDAKVSDLYLDGIGVEGDPKRKHYDCRACRNFLDTVGSLVEVLPDGRLLPAFWEDLQIPEAFQHSIALICEAVRNAKIVEPFVSSEEILGRPKTGDWTHLWGRNESPWRAKDKTAGQRVAEIREDVGLIGRTIAETRLDAISEAVRVLEAEGALPSSEKALPMAKWLLGVVEALNVKLIPGRRTNLLWQFAASAPPGFAHAKNALIGTLLADISSGVYDFDEIRRRWRPKVNPVTYQRPTSISEGSIEAAEKLVDKLGVAKSLPRRYGKLSDVLTWIWQPVVEESAPIVESKSPFAGLKSTRGGSRRQEPVKPLELPAVLVTAEKFLEGFFGLSAAVAGRDVRKIEVLVPSTGAFFGLVSTTDPEAPPILQWDGVDESVRNAVSYYYYVRGSHAAQWSLTPHVWVECSGLTRYPHEWQKPDSFSHFSGGLMFFLKGCVDQQDAYGCFFPSFLRSELHSIRGVLEAYARNNALTGREEADACGIGFGRGNDKNHPIRLRLTMNDGSVKEVTIDRWS